MSLGSGSLGGGTLGSGSGAALVPPPFVPQAPPVVLDVWPVGLPQIPLREGYSESEPDVIKRTDMDEGPAKQRPKFTVGIRPFVLPLELETDQVDILKTFYASTLKDGTLPFAWKHPRSQTAMAFEFMGVPPSFAPVGGRNFRTTLLLKVMP